MICAVCATIVVLQNRVVKKQGSVNRTTAGQISMTYYLLLSGKSAGRKDANICI